MKQIEASQLKVDQVLYLNDGEEVAFVKPVIAEGRILFEVFSLEGQDFLEMRAEDLHFKSMLQREYELKELIMQYISPEKSKVLLRQIMEVLK